jgi:hypothetical protein
MAQFPIPRQLELIEQRVGTFVVPGRVERLEIGHQVLDRHPLGHLLVLGDVADPLEVSRGQPARVGVEHERPARGRLQNVHEHPDRRRLACAVRADQTIDAPPIHGQRQAVQDDGPAEPVAEVFGAHDGAHGFLRERAYPGSSTPQ